MPSAQMLPTALLSLLLLLVSPLSYALDSPHPAPTDKSSDTAGLLSATVPIPTAAPTHHRYGAEPKNFLFARQETLTCGYFDGDANQPNLCGPSSQCIFGGQNPSYFGCCSGDPDSCLAPLSCQTYQGEGNAGAYLTSDSSLVVCGSAVPQCQTTIFPSVGGLDNPGPYTHFDCVESATDVLTLIQGPTTNGGGASSSPSAGFMTYGNETVTVTQTQTQTQSTRVTVPVVVTPPASSSSDSSDEMSTTQEPTGSAGIENSGEVGPTSTGGAMLAKNTAGAGAGIMVLALAAGRALL